MKTTTNPTLGMKTIIKNTLTVNKTSKEVMSTNSRQYIYLTINFGMESYKSYQGIKLRFRQTSSTTSDVKVYLN